MRKLFLLTVLLILVAFPHKVYAFYINMEKVLENSFKASSLDMELALSENPWDEEINSQTSTDRNVSIINAGSLRFAYNIKTGEFSNNTDLCGTLTLTVKDSTDHELYQNSLENFFFNETGMNPDFQIPEGTGDEYNFEVSISQEDQEQFVGETCQFKILGKSWMPESEYGKAYWDEEELSARVTVENVSNPAVQILNQNTEEVVESTSTEQP